MDKRENDEQGEVHLFTEEDFNDNQDVDETPKEEITVDFGEAAESMLDDIKSDSLYGVSASAEADDFDPGELSSDAVINVDDVVVERGESERLAESTDLDEPPESITIDTQETIEYVEDDNDEEASAERAARSRRRLRNLLVFFIIILLVLVGSGLFRFLEIRSLP